MSKLRLRMSMSIDGFVAGPNQSMDDPLGLGGTRLHEWVFPLAVWRSGHGMEGGTTDASTQVIEESLVNVGATIMGRNMFGPVRGEWNTEKQWKGWWGDDPPYHHPVFVLTHFEREPFELEGGNTFTFVTDGIESALDQARRAANGKDVSLAGGARTAQQYLAANLVDEMDISVAPVLLGNGERLFSGSATFDKFEHARTICAPNVTHYKFVRR
ncbi:MAG TPA: dihydrofolate reductase family protein [Gemmatimonadaceae bacterium]